MQSNFNGLKKSHSIMSIKKMEKITEMPYIEIIKRHIYMQS